MKGEILLVILILTGLVGQSAIIAVAASILLFMKLVALDRFFSTVERRGLEAGLLFLTVAVLVPFATEQIKWQHIISLFTTWSGLLALAGGAIATYMNAKGLKLLHLEPQLIIGLIIGSILGIILLNGLPVGPLMAAGISALFVTSLQLIKSFVVK
jgi:uncharacterized membrane protein (DUF441 family)